METNNISIIRKEKEKISIYVTHRLNGCVPDHQMGLSEDVGR